MYIVARSIVSGEPTHVTTEMLQGGKARDGGHSPSGRQTTSLILAHQNRCAPPTGRSEKERQGSNPSLQQEYMVVPAYPGRGRIGVVRHWGGTRRADD